MPVLEAAEVLLDIRVDGDLNSNKTLNNIPCMNKVYADLKHISKILEQKSELEEVKCIIYCSTIRACNDIYEQLHGKSDLKLMMAIYYSSLDGEEKKKKLKLWKDNTIQLMIATNTIGIDFNDKKVQLVIHYAFPLNI
ncbi:9032_t:CDS:2, partial [Funneliformis mosseae]